MSSYVEIWVAMGKFFRTEISKSLGLPYVDSTQGLQHERSQIAQKEGRFAPMYIKFDRVHLDKDGHKAVAEDLFGLLSKSDKAR